MDIEAILDAVYQIQGAADPNDDPGTLAERMQEIFDLACDVMRRTGYQPSDGYSPE